MRQVFQRSRLGEPYDAMVARTHGRVLELLGAAERGDRNAGWWLLSVWLARLGR